MLLSIQDRKEPNTETLQGNYCIRYLGIYIDSHHSLKNHVEFIAKKIKPNVGLYSKMRHYVNINILKYMYFSLINPFIIYGIIS